MCAKTVRKPYRIHFPEVWEEARRQYITGISVAEICRRFGIPRSTLTTRRSAEGWDTQRDRCQALRERLDDIVEEPKAQLDRILSDASQQRTDSGGRSPEQLSALTHGVGGGGVRNLQTAGPVDGSGVLQDAYRDFAEVMNLLLEHLTSDASMTAAGGSRPSRNLLEGVRALEKLQRVQRTALGMDQRTGAGQHVGVLVLPAKLSVDEWQARATATRDPEDGRLLG